MEEKEEVTRIDKCVEGEQRSLKIRFRSQTAAEEVLGRSWKLSKLEKKEMCEYREI